MRHLEDMGPGNLCLSGDGQGLEDLADDAVALKYEPKGAAQGFDTFHMKRFEGTDLVQWFGRRSDGRFHPWGNMMRIVEAKLSPPPKGNVNMTGIELIAAERQRQIEKEGWTPEHDAEHDFAELTGAAIVYAMAGYRAAREPDEPVFQNILIRWWPWDLADMKLADDPIRNLEKAGALIAAEIDRLQAAA